MPRIPAEVRDYVHFQLKFPRALHAELRRCAREIDRRSMQAFIMTAIEEKMGRMVAYDIDSRDFVPEGIKVNEDRYQGGRRRK